MRVNTCRTFRVHDHPLARDKDTDTAVDSRERKLRVDIKSAQTQTLARRPPIFQVLRIVSLALPLLGAGFYLAGGTRRYRGGHVDDHTEDPLTECEETVKELKEENAELRESSERFGALAERLNRANRALADGASVPCPRCERDGYVEVTPPTQRGADLHCTYCGNIWTGQPKG